MPEFIVILRVSLHGSPAHSTRDVIEADSCEEAGQKAIAAWRNAEPRFSYAPLLTIER
jgi:hypothetical protein